jgi:predicted nucleic acid-binding protein
MIHLLDVNVLLAMAYRKHVHYFRTKWWVEDLCGRESDVSFAVCSITECGFVRIASNKDLKFAEDVEAAKQDLFRLKSEWPFVFVDDSLGADRLPAWVAKSKHVTDGHLLALATEHGIPFVTLDRGIPGALLIPEYPEGPSMVREAWVPYGVPCTVKANRSQIATTS